MRPADNNNIEKTVGKLHFKAAAHMHDRILAGVLKAHGDCRNRKSAVLRPNVWRMIMESRTAKLAAAALIVVGVLVGISRYSGSKGPAGKEVAESATKQATTQVAQENQKEPDTELERAVVKAEADIRENIEAMLAAKDVDGLVAMVAEGDLPSKVAAVNYLAKMDDAVKALEVLEKLDATYTEDDPYNPFAIAVVNTRNRVDSLRKTRTGPAATVPEGASALTRATTQAAGGVYDSVPEADVLSSEPEEERERSREVLFGTVVDQRGNPVADAWVFGSYAQYATTDANGSFSLLTSPHDSELGPADFPMFVWAYPDNDPYRVAWTVTRHPEAVDEMGQYPLTEETHQGVELVVEDEDDLARHIPGDPGELFGDIEDDPKVRDIVLVMGPAGVITGRVTDASGAAVASATVQIDELTMQLGTSTLTVSNLGAEWKAEAFAVTDDYGNYQLGNLPISWTSIRLKARLQGYGSGEAQYQGSGSNIVSGCDLQLIEGAQEQGDSGDSEDAERDVVQVEHFEDAVATGYPVKGGGSTVGTVVPTDLYQNVALYYSFHNDADPQSVTDISGRGFHAEVHGRAGGPQYAQDDVLGPGMWFEDNGQIVVPDVYLKEFTFSAWVSPTTDDLNNRRIFTLSDGTDCYALQGNAGDGVGVYVADEVEVNEYNWRLAKDKWTHVTLTHDGWTFAIYKNGQLTESGAVETNGVTGTLSIGGTSAHDGDHWRGFIDEVAVFNRALSETEVAQLFSMTGALENE